MRQIVVIVLLVGALITAVYIVFFRQNEPETQVTVQDAPPEVLLLGAQVYEQYCAACHGPNGEGQVPAAPLTRDETDRFPAPPHNEAGHTWHHDDLLIKRIIREGGMGDDANFYEMPAFGEILTDQQIEAVLAFIKTMWTDEQRQMQAERSELIRQQQGDR